MFERINDQMRRVGVGGLACGIGSGLARQGEEVAGVTLVIQQPLNHRHGKGAVGTGVNGHPAVIIRRVGSGGI